MVGESLHAEQARLERVPALRDVIARDHGVVEGLHARVRRLVREVAGRHPRGEGPQAVGGRTVGVVANNPLRLGGCLDSNSAEKASRFVRMCDAFAVPLVVLVAGALLAWTLGLVKPIPPLGLSHLEIVTPAWDAATLIGLGVPLYLVTMASQNLPGFAVLRGSGYQPPTAPVLATTGAVSLATAFTGAHTSNLAAISAALCTGPEAHPDPAQRWKAGPFYALWWGLIALFGASLVGLFGALPPALLVTVAGTALLGSTAGALGSALNAEIGRASCRERV